MAQPNDAGLQGGGLTAAELERLRQLALQKIAQYQPKTQSKAASPVAPTTQTKASAKTPAQAIQQAQVEEQAKRKSNVQANLQQQAKETAAKLRVKIAEMQQQARPADDYSTQLSQLNQLRAWQPQVTVPSIGMAAPPRPNTGAPQIRATGASERSQLIPTPLPQVNPTRPADDYTTQLDQLRNQRAFTPSVSDKLLAQRGPQQGLPQQGIQPPNLAWTTGGKELWPGMYTPSRVGISTELELEAQQRRQEGGSAYYDPNVAADRLQQQQDQLAAYPGVAFSPMGQYSQDEINQMRNQAPFVNQVAAAGQDALAWPIEGWQKVVAGTELPRTQVYDAQGQPIPGTGLMLSQGLHTATLGLWNALQATGTGLMIGNSLTMPKTAAEQVNRFMGEYETVAQLPAEFQAQNLRIVGPMSPQSVVKSVANTVYTAPTLQQKQAIDAFYNLQMLTFGRGNVENPITYEGLKALGLITPLENQALRNMAYNVAISGPEAQATALNNMELKASVPQIEAERDRFARIAQQTGNPAAMQRAILLANVAASLKETPYTVQVDKARNLWWELFEAVVADPTNALDLVTGPISKAKQGVDIAQAIGFGMRQVDNADDLAALGKVVNAYADWLQRGRQGAINLPTGLAPDLAKAMPKATDLVQSRNMLKQLFDRTQDTKIRLGADTVWQAASNIFYGADNLDDFIRVLDAWVNRPQDLIKGLSGLTSRYYRDTMGKDGLMRWGPATIANPTLMKQTPVLQLGGKKMLAKMEKARNEAMEAAKKAGTFYNPDEMRVNPLEWMADADKEWFNAARQLYGEAPITAPEGAVKPFLRNLPGGQGQIEWLGADGKVIQQGDEIPIAEAKAQIKSIEAALQDAKENPLMQGLETFTNVQRHIMSDMWLNLRPSHWIRNAAAATVATMTDGLYSFKSVDEAFETLGAKFIGGRAAQRLAEGVSGAGSLGETSGKNWTRGMFPKNNPAATLAEKGSEIWTGFTQFLNTIPFGEQAFYVKTFDRAFERMFNEQWTETVRSILNPVMKQWGVDPKDAKAVIDYIIETGKLGSKVDVAQGARKAVYGAKLPFSIQGLKIADEVIPVANQAELLESINSIGRKLPDGTAETPQEALARVSAEVKAKFKQMREKPGAQLADGFPQSTPLDNMADEGADTVATLTDDAVKSAKEAGITDPAELARIEQEAQQYAQRLVQGETLGWEGILDEMSKAPDNPAGLAASFDLLSQVYELKYAARMDVDALMGPVRAAQGTGDKAAIDAAWLNKFDGTREIYTKLADDLQGVFDSSKDVLRRVAAGEEVPQQRDWWDVINRYLDFDEVDNAAVRGQEFGNMSEADPTEVQQFIDANRAYVDSSYIQLYDMFRRYPSLDALDMLRQTQKQLDIEGARAAAFLAPLREQVLAGQLPKEEYYAIRNATWRRMFDNQVIYNQAASRFITAKGLSQESMTGLTWVDEWMGGKFFLLGPAIDDSTKVWLRSTVDDIFRRGAFDKATGKLSDKYLAPKLKGKGKIEWGISPAETESILEKLAVTGVTEKRTDGWYMLITDQQAAKQAVEQNAKFAWAARNVDTGEIVLFGSANPAIPTVEGGGARVPGAVMDDWEALVKGQPFPKQAAPEAAAPVAQGDAPLFEQIENLRSAPGRPLPPDGSGGSFPNQAPIDTGKPGRPTVPQSVLDSYETVADEAVLEAKVDDALATATQIEPRPDDYLDEFDLDARMMAGVDEFAAEAPVAQAAPVVPQVTVTANTLYQLAAGAGIGTARADGAPTTRHLINAINKDAKLRNAGWQIPTGANIPQWIAENPQQADQAAEWLALRVERSAQSARLTPTGMSRGKGFRDLRRKPVGFVDTGRPGRPYTAPQTPDMPEVRPTMPVQSLDELPVVDSVTSQWPLPDTIKQRMGDEGNAYMEARAAKPAQAAPVAGQRERWQMTKAELKEWAKQQALAPREIIDDSVNPPVRTTFEQMLADKKITKAQYNKKRWYYGSEKMDIRANELEYLGVNHEYDIKQALAEGKPVPPEVLADYPDLAPTTPAPRIGGEVAPTAGPVDEGWKAWQAEATAAGGEWEPVNPIMREQKAAERITDPAQVKYEDLYRMWSERNEAVAVWADPSDQPVLDAFQRVANENGYRITWEIRENAEQQTRVAYGKLEKVGYGGKLQTRMGGIAWDKAHAWNELKGHRVTLDGKPTPYMVLEDRPNSVMLQGKNKVGEVDRSRLDTLEFPNNDGTFVDLDKRLADNVAPTAADVPQVTADAPVQAAAPTVLPPAQRGLVGKTVKGWSDPVKQYDFEYEIVPLDNLIVSNLDDGRINPKYPIELQPRDRTQAAPQLQVRKMANTLSPDELLSPTTAIDRGAPIVGPDNVVESGNGRVLAMRAAPYETYGKYTDELISRIRNKGDGFGKDNFGIDEKAFDDWDAATGRTRYALIRRRKSDVDRVEFAKEANARVTLGMNQAEAGKSLAGTLTADDLSGMYPAQTGKLDDAFGLRENQEAVKRIMRRIPRNEQAAYLDSTGKINQEGADAIRSALFSVVFPDNQDIVRNYVTALDTEMRNVGNGIERSIIELARVQLQNPDLGIGKEIAQALDIVSQARAQRMSVAQYFNTPSFFSLPTELRPLAEAIEKNMRSGKGLGRIFTNYAEEAIKHVPGQSAMFGAELAPNKYAMLDAAIAKAAQSAADDQITLFGGLGAVDPTPMIQDIYKTLIKYYRKPKQTEVGDIAAHMVHSLNEAEDRILAALPSLVTPTPNKFTAAQANALIDAIDKMLLPGFDDAVSRAAYGAQKMSDAAMLNYRDRRGFDSLLSLISPYHYYYTRGGATWLRRMARKPSMANLYYDMQRAIETENMQSDVPNRMKGTIPIGGTTRIANPMNFMFPMAMYDKGEFGRQPDATTTDAERLWMGLQGVLPGMMPAYEIAMAQMFDMIDPLPDGEKRTGEFLQTRRWIPPAGTIADATMATTGDTLPTWAGGDSFDPYRIKRTAFVMAQEGALPKPIADYVIQMTVNMEGGGDPWANIPTKYLPQVRAAYIQTAKRAGMEKLGMGAGLGYVAGVSFYNLPEGEQQLRSAGEAWRDVGYGPENPSGSAAQRQMVMEQNPALGTYMSRSAQPGDEVQPGQRAQQQEMYDKLDPLYAQQSAVKDALINRSGMGVSTGALIDATAPVQAQMDVIRGQYPNLPDASTAPPSGANPAERAQWLLKKAIPTKGKPTYPGEGASRATLSAYYEEVRKWEATQLADFKRNLDTVMAGNGDPEQDAINFELYKLMQGKDPADLLREYSSGYSNASPIQQEYQKRQDAQQAERNSFYQAAEQAVMAGFGPQGLALYKQYSTLEDDEREAFRDANPTMKAINFAAYNPQEYMQAVEMFGQDAVIAWANIPASDGSEEASKIRGEYYDANPGAYLMNAWYNGRPTPFGETKGPWKALPEKWGMEYRANMGKDFAQASTMFGPDIWQIASGYKRGWTGKQKAAYFDKYPQLSAFFDWWNDLLPDEDGKTGSSRRGWSNYRRSSYRRSYRNYGYSRRGYSSYRGGGYGYGGGGSYSKRYIDDIDPRQMDWDLWNAPGEGIRKFTPEFWKWRVDGNAK